MFYYIITNKNSTNTIVIPGKLINNHQGSASNTLVRFGGRSSPAKVECCDEAREAFIEISLNLCKALLIPLDIRYQVKIMGKEILLGPVIGLLLARKNNELSIQKLNKFSVYAMSYARFHGLLCIFSAEAVNFEDNSIEGYYFSPSVDSKSLWKKGVLPMPSSVYRRVSISRHIRQKLKDKTGNRLFNSYYFDKLEFDNIARKFDDIAPHLPYTRQFKTMMDLYDMFEQNDLLYIKPVYGSLGVGIVRVAKIGETYSFQGKDDEKAQVFNNKEEAASYISRYANKRKFIIQQGIKCLKYDNRFANFRVIMQKDNSIRWKCIGIICCLGKKGGICSNYANDAYYISFGDILNKTLKLSSKEIFKKKTEIIDICTEMCLKLDLIGENYADLGIDVAIDENLGIWILEINKRHDHTIPLYLNDKQAYYEVKTNPIKYAVAQSGF